MRESRVSSLGFQVSPTTPHNKVSMPDIISIPGSNVFSPALDSIIQNKLDESAALEARITRLNQEVKVEDMHDETMEQKFILSELRRKVVVEQDANNASEEVRGGADMGLGTVSYYECVV
jgi:hypothetical protein